MKPPLPSVRAQPVRYSAMAIVLERPSRTADAGVPFRMPVVPSENIVRIELRRPGREKESVSDSPEKMPR